MKADHTKQHLSTSDKLFLMRQETRHWTPQFKGKWRQRISQHVLLIPDLLPEKKNWTENGSQRTSVQEILFEHAQLCSRFCMLFLRDAHLQVQGGVLHGIWSGAQAWKSEVWQRGPPNFNFHLHCFRHFSWKLSEQETTSSSRIQPMCTSKSKMLQTVFFLHRFSSW